MHVSSSAGTFCGSQAMSRSIASICLGLGGAVLLGPAVDLARDVIAGPAEIAETERCVIDAMQARDDVVERVVDARARSARREPGKRRLPEHAALDVIHDVEGGADDALVEAQRVRARHRHIGLGERGDDAVLAIDRVRRRQQLARRLAAQHEAPSVRRRQQEGRVGLAALELLDGRRARGSPARWPRARRRAAPDRTGAARAPAWCRCNRP